MTSVRLYRDRRGRLSGFSLVGHAGAATAGEDIVCAGLSAVAIAASNALERVARIVVHPHIGEGYLSVRLPGRLTRKRRQAARIILRTARQGFYDIARTHPRHARVSE